VRILVTGATGYVGSRLVSALLDAGYDIVATTRNPDRLAEFGWHDQVTGVALDAHDEASAKKAFADAGPIDVVYYLVHGIGQPDFRDADNRAAAIVANAAKDAAASLVNVGVDTHDATLRLLIRDDGIGGADSRKGSGLIGLQDRVEALGGHMEITSPPGSGTSVHISIPLAGK